ncbi:MAG TPA: trimethylamine methyltransferase family protein [Candidatus Polarisedimenticolia bacterium]|nr:trimethylamine methyltransferase family protein [Candidatus Polarisedimenticolia bacterium]
MSVEAIETADPPRLSLNILGRDDIRRLHTATLDVIESVGVRFPSGRALEILEAHGASIDQKTAVAKIPGAVVEAALAKAPPTYTLAGRDPALDLPLDGRHSYLGTDGCGVEVIDPLTGERHRSTLQDVSDAAHLADRLDAIAFHWTPVSAQDRPPQSRSLHELLAIWSASRKHVQTETIVSAREARAAVEMAALLAGGREALRRRPILSIMQCTFGPLAQDKGSLEAALVAAEAGLPVGFMTMASCASTGPATPAGTLVVGNAEVLSALALMQMAHPGCPVYYAAAQTAIDLKTGAYTGGGPEDFLFGAASNALADFYRVPLSMGAYATGAKEPDWQAGVENSFSSFMAVVTGADMLLGAGLLHGSRILSYAQMVLDAEIWSILRAMSRGIVVNDETLALEAIRDVGPGGTFLTHRHTKKHMRELWQPTVFDRRPYGAWEAAHDGAHHWARVRARAILSEPRPAAIEATQDSELRRLIALVEQET